MPLLLIVIVALFVVVIASLVPRYRRDKLAAITRFRAVAEVLQTPGGPVEYAVRGNGFPVLVLHGTGGGCEQGLMVGNLLDPAKFKIIAVTRAGYRRTPLATGPSFEEQADAALAVLDALKIGRVGVIGFSGGGPGAIQFGLRHADRCLALVLLSAHGPGTLRIFSAPLFAFVGRLVEVMLSVDFPMWLLIHVPIQVPLFLLGERMEALRDVSKLDIAQGVLDGGFPPSDYKAGAVNDIVQVAKLRSQPEWPLGDIKAPTIVLHGTRDLVVRFGAAKFHAEHIPGARLIAYKGGTHFVASTQQQDVAQKVTELMSSASQFSQD